MNSSNSSVSSASSSSSSGSVTIMKTKYYVPNSEQIMRPSETSLLPGGEFPSTFWWDVPLMHWFFFHLAMCFKTTDHALEKHVREFLEHMEFVFRELCTKQRRTDCIKCLERVIDRLDKPYQFNMLAKNKAYNSLDQICRSKSFILFMHIRIVYTSCNPLILMEPLNVLRLCSKFHGIHVQVKVMPKILKFKDQQSADDLHKITQHMYFAIFQKPSPKIDPTMRYVLIHPGILNAPIEHYHKYFNFKMPNSLNINVKINEQDRWSCQAGNYDYIIDRNTNYDLTYDKNKINDLEKYLSLSLN